jgi:hypothetical protein
MTFRRRPPALGEVATPPPILADAPSERAAVEGAITSHDRLARAAGIDPEIARAIEEMELRRLHEHSR